MTLTEQVGSAWMIAELRTLVQRDSNTNYVYAITLTTFNAIF